MLSTESTQHMIKSDRFPVVFGIVFVLLVMSIVATIGFSVAVRKTQETRSQAAVLPSSTSSAVPRGNPWDLWADVVIGQRDFGELTPRSVVPDKLNSPAGVAVDRSVFPGRMYIWDSGNSRILGVDLASCYASSGRCQPSIVIGQPSASDHGACNRDASYSDFSMRTPASADTLCGVWEGTHTVLEDKSFASMTVDREGNLYVPDANNNRVLKFNKPFTTDAVADAVWGQADFSGNLCNRSMVQSMPGTPSVPVPNPTASSICFGHLGGGVTTDRSGNVWVADSNNHRVLRFPPNSGTANLVLGQPNFETRDGTMLQNPLSVRVDDTGAVWVADSEHNRVLKFVAPFSNGMQPAYVLGGSSVFNLVTNLEIDPFGRGIWVSDFSNGNTHRLYQLDGIPTAVEIRPGVHGGGSIGIDLQLNVLVSNYALSNVELVQWIVPPPNNCRQHDGDPTACQAQQGCAFYACSGQCWPNFTSNQVACAGIPAGGGYGRMRNLYMPPVGKNLSSSNRLENTSWTGITTLAEHDQLAVADGRLLFWNGLASLENGRAPDGYLGTNSATTIPDPQYGQLKTDNKSRLWASTLTNIQVFTGPLTAGQLPTTTIEGAIPVKGGGSITLSHIHGIAPTADGSALWVSMAYHQQRVVRIQNPLTAPVIDIVLGQLDAQGTYCNRDGGDPRNENPWGGQSNNDTLNTLCWPGAISLDKNGNLFVSDHLVETAGNFRMLMFGHKLFDTTKFSRNAVFGLKATKVFPRNVAGSPHMHFEMAFNSKNQMVVGQNPYSGKRQLEYYKQPDAVNLANPYDAAYARPDGTFGDFFGWPVALTFDAQDNLYAYDANRSKVLIYKQPVFQY